MENIEDIVCKECFVMTNFLNVTKKLQKTFLGSFLNTKPEKNILPCLKLQARQGTNFLRGSALLAQK